MMKNPWEARVARLIPKTKWHNRGSLNNSKAKMMILEVNLTAMAVAAAQLYQGYSTGDCSFQSRLRPMPFSWLFNLATMKCQNS
jgi:hypothetical protein